MPRIVSLAFAIALFAQQTVATAGDPERGEDLYERRCFACHSLDANRVGPAHRGVYGRKAGSAPGYSYSPALKKSGIVWDEAALDKWLTNPQALIPGQRMGFRLGDAAERADIIAFLKRQSRE
ncbi:MAG TPA: cytochrome c family protein [Alphaproteobacteria bacterium]|nr:cytochrome c family protein [Alphaproteobacteria bacterium]